MAKIRIGLVGAGLIGRDHVLSLKRNPQVAKLSVFDADQARAKKLADEQGISTADSLKTLIDESDLVWVCTPPFAHRPTVEAACKAGKAVFCEKPLAHNEADAKAIRAAVLKAKVPFFMGQSGRYSAFNILMKSLLDKGVVGKPTRYWSIRQGFLDPTKSPKWRLEDASSGGVIVELGVHEVDFIGWMGGPWKSVAAAGSWATLNPGKYLDAVVASGVMKNGAMASLDISWACARYLWQRGIDGTEGSLYFDDSALRQIALHRPGKTPKIFLTKETDWMDRKTGENLSLRDQSRAVVSACVKGAKPAVTLDDGFTAVMAAIAIYKAAQSGKAISL